NLPPANGIERLIRLMPDAVKAAVSVRLSFLHDPLALSTSPQPLERAGDGVAVALIRSSSKIGTDEGSVRGYQSAQLRDEATLVVLDLDFFFLPQDHTQSVRIQYLEFIIPKGGQLAQLVFHRSNELIGLLDEEMS